MPSVSSNTLYECDGCGATYDFENLSDAAKHCPKCGANSYTQKVVVFVCDFCSAPGEEEDAWTYPCASFKYGIEIPGYPKGASKGEWAACQACHELIDADDYDSLLRRAVDAEIAKSPELKKFRPMFLAMVGEIHNGFRAHRTGAVKPPTKES